MNNALRFVVTLVCWVGFQAGASAALEGGSKPTQPASPRPQEPIPKPADAPAVWREGTVTAVNLAEGRVQIQGQWHDWVAGKSKLSVQGKPVGVDALKAGQSVRFTVSASAPGRSTIVAIHVP